MLSPVFILNLASAPYMRTDRICAEYTEFLIRANIRGAVMEELKYRYNELISEYLARFAHKQGLELDDDSMQSDFFGFCEGTYIFSINDIRLDIDKNVPAGAIINWYLYFTGTGTYINYRSWLIGAR